MIQKRILVVDDEPLIAMLLCDWLEELGHTVIGPAHSVKDALALLESEPVDGAILDVTLGQENSFDIAEALQKLSVPTVFATGHGPDSLEERFRAAPMLPKPFDFAAVEQALTSFGA